MGECGLDRSIEIDFELQKQCLLRQAELAGELSLPLVLHCVRAYPEMIALKKRFGSSVSWVIHGFRGREQTARELLKHGFTLSLSSVWLRHIDKLYDCIIDSGFLLETDDGKEKIEELYPLAACLAGMDAGELKESAGWLKSLLPGGQFSAVKREPRINSGKIRKIISAAVHHNLLYIP